MSGKITPSVGDVAVPSFWLDPTMTAAWRGLGGSGFNTDPNLEHDTPIFGFGVGQAGIIEILMLGPIQKSQYPSRRPAEKAGAPPQKSLILTKSDLSRSKISSPAAGSACLRGKGG